MSSVMILFSIILFTIAIPSLIVCEDVYSIDASNIYTWGASYPQSCECEESGASSSSCSYFQCTCICDINAGRCDYGCCCDPDCDSTQISRFDSLGVCLTEGTEYDETRYCYSSTDLAKINPRSTLSGESTAARGVDGALCVYKKNTVTEADYYENTDLQSSSIFSTSSGEKSYDYIETTPSTTLRDVYYDQNDTITAYYDLSSDGTQLTSYGIGYWQIPIRDFTGYCNDFNLVEFEVDIVPDTNEGCIRNIPSSSSEFVGLCDGIWSLNYYITRLRLAADASTLPATTSNVEIVSVSVVTVYHQDFVTGIVTELDLSLFSTTNCNTSTFTSVNSASFYDNCGITISQQLSQLLGNSSLFCRSAVQSVIYEVNHGDSAAGTISTVLATVTLVDIPMSTSDNQFQQYFEVKFYSDYATGQSQSNGNLVARSRSGNPGYIVGKPVVFGAAYYNTSYSTSTPAYILESVDGFRIVSPFMKYDNDNPSDFGQSLCPTGSQVEYITTVPLKFGYDITTGCILKLSRNDLIDICCQGASCATTSTSPYSHPSTGIPYFFNFTDGYIGIFGNADPLDESQWFQISQSVSSATRSWTENTNTCSNMYTALNYEFLVAKTGEKTYPQNKIVAATADITTSDWVYRYPSTSSLTQTFQLTITATFIYTNAEDLVGYVPPAPPVLFSVPYDVFYPFQSTSDSSKSIQVGTYLWIVSIGAIVFMML